MRTLIIIALIFFQTSIEIYYAKVVGVTDGDTIVVLTEDKAQVKVRLEGIDCPEKGQPFGDRAKQATAGLCFNKTVRVEKTGLDRYGRTLAFVYVGDTCLNEELLKQGMAWHFKRYNSDSTLANLENQARKMKVGLWSDARAIPPWEWRKKP